MLLKSVITKYPQLLARNISYVQRARLLEKIKNDDDFCKESMVNGKFLLYNKGQPLLKKGSGPGDHLPQFVEFQDCSQVCPDVLDSSVALSVSDEGQPIFASMMSKEADPISVETKTLATFTDLRVGLFLVNQTVAHQLSKVLNKYVQEVREIWILFYILGLVIVDVEQKEQVL